MNTCILIKPEMNNFQKASIRNGAGLTGCLHFRRMQIDPYLSLCTKFKCKWIKVFKIKPDTLNLIEEKVRNCLKQIGIGDKLSEQNTNSTGTKINNE